MRKVGNIFFIVAVVLLSLVKSQVVAAAAAAALISSPSSSSFGSSKVSGFFRRQGSRSLRSNPQSMLGSLLSSSSTSSLLRRRDFLGKAAVLIPVFAMASSSPSFASAAGSDNFVVGGKIQYGDESIMAPKSHGTTEDAVQSNLMYEADQKTADNICSFNRHYAEASGTLVRSTWFKALLEADGPLTFYDSVSGEPLYRAPIGRSAEDLIKESRAHGWPSFRDEETIWENVKVLPDGETVSTVGTHLGHNLPDRNGNRYCINLCCIAGRPKA